MTISLSIITALTAIIAVVISTIQIIKSNKQKLFDRRTKIFLVVEAINSLCESNNSIFKQKIDELQNTSIVSVEFLFLSMTNTLFLEPCQAVVGKDLKSDEHRIFLLKLGELKSMREECALIFPKKVSVKIGDFLLLYQQTLMNLYQYMLLMNRMISKDIPFSTNNTDLTALRIILINNLNNLIDVIDEGSLDCVLKKAKKTIKL